MFHWICPECGGEIAPTVRECPVCDPSAAPVELTRKAGVNGSSTPVSAPVLTAAMPAVAVLKVEGAKSADEIPPGGIALAIMPDSAPDAEDTAPILEVGAGTGDESKPEASPEAPDSPLAANGASVTDDAVSTEIAASAETDARTTELGAASLAIVPALTEGLADAARTSEERPAVDPKPEVDPKEEEPAGIDVAAASSIPEVSPEPLPTTEEHLRLEEEPTAAISDAAEATPVEAAWPTSALEGKSLPAAEVERSDESERRGASPLEPGDLLELAAVVGMREADDADQFEEALTAAAESTPEPPVAAGAEALPEPPLPDSSVQPGSVDRDGARDPSPPPFSPAIDLHRTIATLRATAALPKPPQLALLASAPTPIEQATSLPRSPVLHLGPVPSLETSIGLETTGSCEAESQTSVIEAEPAAETESTVEAASTEVLSPEEAPEPGAVEPDAEPEVVAAISPTEESTAIAAEIDSTVSPVIESPPLPLSPASITESAGVAKSGDAARRSACATFLHVNAASEEDSGIAPPPAVEEAAQTATDDLIVKKPGIEERVGEASVAEITAGGEESTVELPAEAQSFTISELEATPDQDAEAALVEQSAAAERPAVHDLSLGEADVLVPPVSQAEEQARVTAGPQDNLSQASTSQASTSEASTSEASTSEASTSEASTSEASGASEVDEAASIETKAQEEPAAAEVTDEPAALGTRLATGDTVTSLAVTRLAEPDGVEAGLELTGAPNPTSVLPASPVSGQAPQAENNIEPEVPEISALGPSLPLAPLQDYRPTTPSGMRPAQPDLKILKPNAIPSMTLPGPLLPPKLVTFQEGQIDGGSNGKGRSKKGAIPGWVVSGLVAIVLLGVGAVAVLPSLPRSNTEGKAISTESPAPAAQDVSYPLAKSVEVTGFRIVVDFNKKSEIHYLVVNHSSANLTGVNIFVTLQSGNAKAGQPPLCRFSFLAPDLGPFESKEMISSIEKLNRSVSLPDWQDLRVDVQVAP